MTTMPLFGANDLCKVAHCRLPKSQHDTLNHEFSTDGSLVPKPPSKTRTQKSSGRVRAGVSGDPVLRFLLVDKGIITPRELEEAEDRLRATGLLRTDAPERESDD